MTLWWVTIGLEVLILLRSVWTGLYREFRFFYTYLFVALLQSLFLLYIYIEHPRAYPPAYWFTQIPLVLLGYAVIAEIFSKAFVTYPGLARLSRRLLLGILAIILVHAAINAWISGPGWALGRTSVELERNLRAMQVTLLAVFFGLTRYYATPIGRNLRGVSVGYALFVGTSVVHLAFRAYLPSFQRYWEVLQPAAFLVVLLVWTSALWSVHAAEEPKDKKIETDYETLVKQTIRALRYVRAQLVKG